ncbi:type I phosphomannose isomerase catalytic subunit [Wenzhouxiangella limi]|uniref:Mannose-6-phosphate isomerase n=1 Tax=Wenzhouxiangella limi TaxID=2707351 RepID=A0A845UZF4_9GAMM|nr:type I phosphomannose isomerase catalytic subunit [Wenzhouxiangella limi]NDY95300.1 mannose-6-phosphate isomerase [Wenzhouxiangella limi]
MNTIQFKPIYQERVWGGRWLAGKFGRELPGANPVGESWEMVDRPEAQSVCTRTGKTLRELLQQHSAEIMGPLYDPAQPFPILVKWLDCSDRLSLQVHPPAKIAAELDGEPKTECWYLADTTPDAALIVGLKRGVTRENFEQAIQDEALEPLLHRFPVKPGESILLESGRLHAIDAGNLILEIQQNSDTTYRVYDWGRKGLDGKPRQLHVTQSLKSIDFEDFEPAVTPASSEESESVLAECPQFRIRQRQFVEGERFGPPRAREPMILSVVEGELREGESGEVYTAGANLLLPYAWDGELICSGCCMALVTDRFVDV